MISKLAFLSLLLIGSLATISAEPLAPNDVKGLLEKIRAQRAGAPQVQSDFAEQKDVQLMNKPISSTAKVWFQEPNKFRREVQGRSPSITVSDGAPIWISYTKCKSVEKHSVGKN